MARPRRARWCRIADGGAVRQPIGGERRLAGMRVVRFVAGLALVSLGGCAVSQVGSGSPSPSSSEPLSASQLRSAASAARSSSPVSAPAKQSPPMPSPPNSPDPSGWAALFTVSGRLSFGMGGPNPELAGMDATSLFLTGAFTDSAGQRAALVRVDRASLRIAATADPPDLTAVAYGVGALWWATGHPNIDAGCNCTPPPPSRLLLKLDPVNLAVIQRFQLPAAPTLVTVAGGTVWVAAADALMRIDPNDGRVLATVELGFQPVSVAGSPDGTTIYVLGDTVGDDFVLLDADAATGTTLGRAQGPLATYGPLAVTAAGVWAPETDLAEKSTRMQLFTGPELRASASVDGLVNDAVPYVAGNTLWVIDFGGIGPTMCADPATGAVRVRGAPVGSSIGTMLSDATTTYLLNDVGVNDTLLRIAVRHNCD